MFSYDLDWRWYKNGKNDTKSKKKKKRAFWRSTIFDHLPPCGFVNFINFIKTPLYFFFLGTTLGTILSMVLAAYILANEVNSLVIIDLILKYY